MGNYKYKRIIKNEANQREFSILKNNKSYLIKIILNINNIFIKYKDFQKILDLDNFYRIFNVKYYTIIEIFNYIINIFQSKRVIIKDLANNNLILKLKIFDNLLEIYNEIEIILEKNDKKFTEISDLKNIRFLENLSEKSYNCYSVDKTFIVFKAINNITFLIFASENASIICFNLNNNQIISEIDNAHEKEYITNISHFYEKKYKKDIIMSVSGDNNNIKLWNFCDWKCILNIKNINQIGFIESACIFYSEKNLYIISSNWNYEETEKIKVFDIKGKKIKEINNSNEKTYYVNTYYDDKKSILYIITGNLNYIKSYFFKKNKLYKKYFEKENGPHLSIIIYNKNDKTQIIESCIDGFIRIWGFHTSEFIIKIDASLDNFKGIFGICLWNEKYLFAGCNNKEIEIIDLEKNIIIKRLKGHKRIINCLKKVIHPKYGECLISQGYKNDQIKLWVI